MDEHQPIPREGRYTMFRAYLSNEKKLTSIERFELCRQRHRRAQGDEPTLVYCPEGEADALTREYPYIEFVEKRWCATGKYLLNVREQTE